MMNESLELQTQEEQITKKVSLMGKQVYHAHFLLNSINKRRFGMDLSIMGTGKTYTSSFIAKELNCPVFVVCPEISQDNWSDVLNEFDVENFQIINYEKVIRGNTPFAKKVERAQDPRYKNNKHDMPSVFLLEWDLPEDTFIIFDESHKCKGLESLCSELLLSAWEKKYKFLTLSATQAATPLDMFIVGRILGYHNFFDYKEWLKEFDDPNNTYFRVKLDMELPHAREKMKEIHDDIFYRGIASRMTPEDFPDRFKNNEIIPMCYDMKENGEEINRIYADMKAEIARLEERGYTECILAEIMKARRRAELLKVNTFVELATEAYHAGNSVCIFVNFVDTLNAIKSRLIKKFGGNLVSDVFGGQKKLDRKVSLAKFQSDVSRFMVSNIQAGGVSVNMHDMNGIYPRVSYISPCYSAVLFMQVTGRTYRNGAKTDCLQYVVFCKNTIEEPVCYKLKGKVRCLNLLNDGDLDVSGYGLEYDFQQDIDVLYEED
jgi:superfamily II DNA or RNA helicase